MLYILISEWYNEQSLDISGYELFLKIITLIVNVKCLLNIEIKVSIFYMLTKVIAELCRVLQVAR